MILPDLGIVPGIATGLLIKINVLKERNVLAEPD
jgi:hypothetical protein